MERLLYDLDVIDDTPKLAGLLRIRHALGLTQAKMAELLETSEVSVRRSECGYQGFTSEKVKNWASRLGRNWWELFGFDHPPDVTLTRETAEAIQIMEQLTPDGRQLAVEQMKALSRVHQKREG